jgi:hypothetical protein
MSARHRALELLAASPDGLNTVMLSAHGVSLEEITDLVDAGLVVTHREHVGRGRRPIWTTRVLITDRGREALT